jgi:hypothetical protein
MQKGKGKGKTTLYGTIHLSHKLRKKAPRFCQILAQGPWSRLKTEDAGKTVDGGRRRHDGEGGMAGEHPGVCAHSLVPPAWLEVAQGRLATRARWAGGCGHAASMRVTTSTLHRARGGRRYDRRGEPIWATSGLNQSLGQK